MAEHTGNKYHRLIRHVPGAATPVEDGCVIVDIYAVLEAFAVTCPARQHAIKKLLAAGLRGKGDTVQDLTEARDALTRAIELEKARKG